MVHDSVNTVVQCALQYSQRSTAQDSTLQYSSTVLNYTIEFVPLPASKRVEFKNKRFNIVGMGLGNFEKFQPS